MCLSKEAKIFISKLLKPDPQDRGDFEESSTDCILHHHFLSPTYSQMPPFKKINKKELVSKFNHSPSYSP